jgi:hypothetical protein
MKKPKKVVRKVKAAPELPPLIINLSFSVQAIQLLLHHLGQLPFNEVAALYIEIQDKANEQLHGMSDLATQNGAFTVSQPKTLPAPQ